MCDEFYSKGSKLVIKIVLSYFPTSNSIYSVWSFGFNRSIFRKNGLIVRNKYLFSPHFSYVFLYPKKFSLVVKNREVVKIGTETNTTTETFLLLCSFFLSSSSTTYHVWSCNAFKKISYVSTILSFDVKGKNVAQGLIKNYLDTLRNDKS